MFALCQALALHSEHTRSPVGLSIPRGECLHLQFTLEENEEGVSCPGSHSKYMIHSRGSQLLTDNHGPLPCALRGAEGLINPVLGKKISVVPLLVHSGSLG